MVKKKFVKKREEMTPEELEHLRKLEREKKQRRRMKLTKEEKYTIREKETLGRAEARKKMTKEEKEYKNVIERERRARARKKMGDRETEKERISALIGMRKYRLTETEESKKLAREKAKKGMRILRREGPIRKYLERTRRHVWTVKWRKFLSLNTK